MKKVFGMPCEEVEVKKKQKSDALDLDGESDKENKPPKKNPCVTETHLDVLHTFQRE